MYTTANMPWHVTQYGLYAAGSTTQQWNGYFAFRAQQMAAAAPTFPSGINTPQTGFTSNHLGLDMSMPQMKTPANPPYDPNTLGTPSAPAAGAPPTAGAANPFASIPGLGNIDPKQIEAAMAQIQGKNPPATAEKKAAAKTEKTEKEEKSDKTTTEGDA